MRDQNYYEEQEKQDELRHKEYQIKHMPFNLIAHGALIQAGYEYEAFDVDIRDDGDGETGPMPYGTPAHDMYTSPTVHIYVDTNGLIVHIEKRDLELEAWFDKMEKGDFE